MIRCVIIVDHFGSDVYVGYQNCVNSDAGQSTRIVKASGLYSFGRLGLGSLDSPTYCPRSRPFFSVAPSICSLCSPASLHLQNEAEINENTIASIILENRILDEFLGLGTPAQYNSAILTLARAGSLNNDLKTGDFFLSGPSAS